MKEPLRIVKVRPPDRPDDSDPIKLVQLACERTAVATELIANYIRELRNFLIVSFIIGAICFVIDLIFR